MKEIKLSKRVTEVESPIRDVLVKARQLEKAGMKIIPLNIGDPCKFDFETPMHIKKACMESIIADRAVYAPSEGIDELRVAVGKHEGVSEENVIITAGVSEGANYVLSSLMNDGDNMLMASPSYTQYLSMCNLLNAKANFFHCVDDWEPDIDDLRKKINSRSRGIIIISPNNPNGAVYSEKTLKEIANIAAENRLPVISDEIYDKITYDKKATPFSKICGDDVPYITVNGFSKVYLMTGYRVGWLAFRNVDAIRDGVAKLCRLRLSMNIHSQKAALAAIEGPTDHIAPMVAKLKKRRDLVYKRLNEIEGLRCTKPEGAFYIFPGIEAGKWKTDKEFVYDLLENTGVLTVFGSGFSPVLMHKHFRIVFLAQEEFLADAMDRIEGFMKDSKSRN